MPLNFFTFLPFYFFTGFQRLHVQHSQAVLPKCHDKARNRQYYRRKHKKNPKETRGRKRIRRQKYKPLVLSNGDTKVELLTRSRNLLSQSGDKWGEHKKERARLLFDLYPQMQEGYSLICKVRDIFKRKLTIDEARHRLHEWYKDVNICTLREIKAARDCIKSREVEVLNYFINRGQPMHQQNRLTLR